MSGIGELLTDSGAAVLAGAMDLIAGAAGAGGAGAGGAGGAGASGAGAGGAGSDPLRAAAALARVFPDASAALRAAALTQAELRRHAATRFGADAARMFFTREGLEQCTRPTVAAHRAASLRARAPDARTALDLCCGLGSDLIALARAGFATTGVDRDPEVLLAAGATLRALGLAGRLVENDVTAVDPGSADVVVTDPARRTAAGGRLRDPEQFSPPWSWVRTLLDRPGIRACVSTTPALAYSHLPAGCEAEWVDDHGSTVELAVWSPALTGAGIRRRATLLGPVRGGEPTPDAVAAADPRAAADPKVTAALTDADEGAGDVLPVDDPHPGQWVLEPRGAILRAGLLGVLAARVSGSVPGPGIGYLITDDPAGAHDPATGIELAAALRIAEVLPLRARVLRQRLRGLGAGSVEILARGVQVDISSLRSQLLTPGAGHAAATLVLTRTASGAVALLAERRVTERPVTAGPVTAGPVTARPVTRRVAPPGS